MTTPTPQFGNSDQIELLKLEAKNEGVKEYFIVRCDCGCPNCDAELEECPYCKEKSRDQFTDDGCKDCKKEPIPYWEARKMKELKATLGITK